MILKLVLKDMRAFGFRLLIFLFLLIAFNCFMASNDKNASWWLFILITSAGVSSIIPAFLVLDKNYKGEILSCSLPVSRKEIILSKFLLLFIIAAAGYILIYISAVFMDGILNYPDFYVFTHPLMLLIEFTYFSTLISITMLILSTTGNIIWMVVANLTYLVVFILGLDKIVFTEGIAASYDLLSEGLYYSIIFTLFTVLILIISFRLSIKYYSLKNI